MEKIMGNTEEILDRYVSGFRQYILQNTPRLGFVSRNLCELLGCSKEDLLDGDGDRYAARIHPTDRQVYADFLSRLSAREQTLSVQYRLLAKDGSVKYVSDTATSEYLVDGTLVAHASLTDITPIQTENENLRFLNETIPCGFLKYTCEKQPKVTYINDQMVKMLRFPEIKDGEIDYLELYSGNIYLMIPMEERRMFSHFLHRVDTQDTPVSGELTVLRCDGTKARLFGWVTKCVNQKGETEFQSICMDITEKYHTKKANETARYLKALTDVYDKIFEYDLSNRTVKCLHGQQSDLFSWVPNISMHMEEATEQWIESSVYEGDRDRVRGFFHDFYQSQQGDSEAQPPQLHFRAWTSIGALKKYIGLFLKIDPSVSFFCCRATADNSETDSLRNENISLRNINENMQELVMRFTDGLAAFEVTEDRVTPLYASDNICEFFGFTREEWIPMMKQSNSIKEFVSRSGVDYEKFKELLANGEAEFTYFDVNAKVSRRIKAICSQRDANGSAPRFIMLYKVNDADRPTAAEAPIYIRTFGYFDVFVAEKPIAFRNKKSKELFALLVDRRGGYVTSEEAISFLWEDEPVNAVTLARYRKVALRLKNILEEYGIADIVESVDGKRRIVLEKVRCDLYDYLTGREEYAQLFMGSYLTNYSWGETTLGELLNEHIH